MRKSIISIVPVAAFVLMSGCSSVASADNDEILHSQIVLDMALIDDGFYLSDNDSSYIHISDGQIELCDYDFERVCRSDYEKLTDEQKQNTDLDSFVSESVKWFEDEAALQEFTPVKFCNGGEEGNDLILLVLNYEYASSVGAYTGYVFNKDGTICKVDNTYSYFGEELPEGYGADGISSAEAATDGSATFDVPVTGQSDISE